MTTIAHVFGMLTARVEEAGRMRVVVVAGLVIVSLLGAACGGEESLADSGVEIATDFDRAAVEERARALLGATEDEVDRGRLTRVVRRGDEELPATMDLVPGRLNVELDPDVGGTLVVTRVVVEVPDGEEPLVAE